MREQILVFTIITEIIFSRVVNNNSVNSVQASNFLKQYDIQLSTGMDFQMQETTRYIYVGAGTCASKCHNNQEMGFQYEKWKSSRHSESYIILASEQALLYSQEAGIKENPQESQVCLKCHITGSGLDPSSFADTYRRDEGVTCEACHKGEFITKTFLPDKAECLKCHTDSVHNIPPFDFEEGCTKISHPRPKSKPGKS